MSFIRPDWNETYMNMAIILSKQSTCAKLQTAALLVNQGRIISTGINGVCSKRQHCNEYWYNFVYENKETQIKKIKKETNNTIKNKKESKDDNSLTATQSLFNYLNRNKKEISSTRSRSKTRNNLKSKRSKSAGTSNDKYKKFIKSDEFLKLHKDWSEKNELHAESNALLFAAKEGRSTNNSVLYTIYSPCNRCAKEIIIAGISKVYYLNKYSDEGIEFLEKNNIKCINL